MTKKDRPETGQPAQDQKPNSIVDKLIQNEIRRKDRKAQLIEKGEEWKNCINRLAATGDGEYFLKILIKHAGIFGSDEDYNGVTLVKDKARKAFYLDHVRPYLDLIIKNKVES